MKQKTMRATRLAKYMFMLVCLLPLAAHTSTQSDCTQGRTRISCTLMDIKIETGYLPTREEIIQYLQQCGALAYHMVLSLDESE